YQQEEEAHLVKLEQFLDHYLSDLPAECGQWLRRFNLALNRGEDCGELWAQWPRYSAIWQQHGRSWSQKLLRDGDLVTRLVKFLESRI
ncbi:MAG: elongation factor P maturation arginine rhamnosyltransferase EarP, partial [Aeromonas veronii]